LCRERFSRVFRECKGVSPQEFVIRARLDKARAMLAHSGLSVAEVAKACGYSSEFFFSRQFKQRSGLSPSALRKTFALAPSKP
jgi:transcriptional regulator GlxA family with amidase domain